MGAVVPRTEGGTVAVAVGDPASADADADADAVSDVVVELLPPNGDAISVTGGSVAGPEGFPVQAVAAQARTAVSTASVPERSPPMWGNLSQAMQRHPHPFG